MSQHPVQSQGAPPSPSSIRCICEHFIVSAHFKQVYWVPAAPMLHTVEHWAGRAGGGGREGGGGGDVSGFRGGSGGDVRGGVGGFEGGALVSTTVLVGAVTTRPVRFVIAAARVVEIMLALTLLAWACMALLWLCMVA